MALRSLGRNALDRRLLPEMLRKAVRRVTHRRRVADAAAAKTWARASAVDGSEHLRAVDPALWDESLVWADEFASSARERLAELPFDLGGGGHYPLLWFVVRVRRPSTVLETGVAAGWTSAAILAALDANAHGHLWSSDLPYFRLARPERYVGWLVPPQARRRWTLTTVGDRRALPDLVSSAGSVDLFHYDSDKSYAGRASAWRVVQPVLSDDALVIWDDIQDNWHFRDLVEGSGLPYQVLSFEGKYVGLIGDLASRTPAG